MIYRNYIAIEGPDGSGKSSVAKLLAERFVKEGYNTKECCQPTKDSSIGKTVRDLFLMDNEKLDRLSMQMLIAGDARNQNTNIIESKHLENGGVCIVDRIYMSGLVGGYVDGYSMDDIWEVFKPNNKQLQPGLICMMTSDVDTLSKRINARGVPIQSRYEKPENIAKNHEGYQLAKEFLIKKGHTIWEYDTTNTTAEQVVDEIWDYYTHSKYPYLWGDEKIGCENSEWINNDRPVLNKNAIQTSAIINAVFKNDGNCPCRPVEPGIDSRCPCPPFLNDGHCCCKLFVPGGGNP